METMVFFLLPLTAFLYASVGHGGASSYLMLLTLLHFAPQQIRPTALLLNMAVSLLAFFSYYKNCIFPTKLFLVLVIFSVPAAFLGGKISLETDLYKKIIGFVLFVPVLHFFTILPIQKTEKPILKENWFLALVGLSIGFLSGLIGIGGGIILSPIVLLLAWADTKQTAALSALFIFVNSIAGFLGMQAWKIDFEKEILLFIPLTLIGGISGAYFGAFRWQTKRLKMLLASVLLVAAIKLIFW